MFMLEIVENIFAEPPINGERLLLKPNLFVKVISYCFQTYTKSKFNMFANVILWFYIVVSYIAKRDIVLESQLPQGMSGEKLKALEQGPVPEVVPEEKPQLPPKFLYEVIFTYFSALNKLHDWFLFLFTHCI